MANQCYTCLNCGKLNPVKGHSYTNKYCNNSCQQQHQRRMTAFRKLEEWKEYPGSQIWAKVPDWTQRYLIDNRGHRCETCNNTVHNNQPIPLTVEYRDGTYNNSEDNLELICPNCLALR